MSTDHKAEAERLLEQSSKSNGDPTVWLLAAQAEATLALVEQQRIANLIEILNNAREQTQTGSVNLENYLDLYNTLNPQITKGLGL